MKRKILLILLVSLALFTTACGKTNEVKKEKNNKQDNKQEVKKEEKINVVGTYFIYNDKMDSIYYDDYLTLKEDKSFDRQVNYCAGIDHLEGTYEVKKEDDKTLIEIKIKDHENLPLQFEYKDDKLMINEEQYINSEDYYDVLNFLNSCNSVSYQMTFNKGDDSQIDYKEPIYADAFIGPGPNE